MKRIDYGSASTGTGLDPQPMKDTPRQTDAYPRQTSASSRQQVVDPCLSIGSCLCYSLTIRSVKTCEHVTKSSGRPIGAMIPNFAPFVFMQPKTYKNMNSMSSQSNSHRTTCFPTSKAPPSRLPLGEGLTKDVTRGLRGAPPAMVVLLDVLLQEIYTNDFLRKGLYNII